MRHTITLKNTFLCFLFFCNHSVFSQNKFNYSINFGINQPFLSDLNGIRDYTGFAIKDLSIGFNLGSSFEYNILPKTIIFTGGNIISMERKAFSYYGLLYLRSSGKPQFYLGLKQFFSKNKHYYLNARIIASVELIDSYSIAQYSQGVIRPERTFIETSKSKINPLFSFGIGNRKEMNNGRIIEYNLFFNYGYKVVNSYTFKRLTNPKIISTFSYKGNTLNFVIKWFFKKK